MAQPLLKSLYYYYRSGATIMSSIDNHEHSKFTLLGFSGKTRILHLTWLAFFMSFVVWLGLGPLMPFIKEALDLSDQQAKVLLILNVALTIPARVVVGMLVDKYGPRIMYCAILVLGGLISIGFAWADSYEALALMRFLSGFIGAGFVVGIRMIGEWYPARQTGIAQGIYGGWGNFGSAGAAMVLPVIAINFGGDDGWRIAAIAYGLFYFRSVTDTPEGSTYFKPKKSGAMEITSKGDLVLYILMNIPLYLALGVLAWKLSPAQMGLIGDGTTYAIYAVLLTIYLCQLWKIWQVNAHILTKPVPELHRYKFKQVAILDWAYLVTFGTELAIVLMLAMFYVEWFELPKITAALLAGIYPFINLIARPGGGWLSDRIGRNHHRFCRHYCQLSGAWHGRKQLANMAGPRHDHHRRHLLSGWLRSGLCDGTTGTTTHDGADCGHGRRLWQRRCSDLSHRKLISQLRPVLPFHRYRRRPCVCFDPFFP